MIVAGAPGRAFDGRRGEPGFGADGYRKALRETDPAGCGARLQLDDELNLADSWRAKTEAGGCQFVGPGTELLAMALRHLNSSLGALCISADEKHERSRRHRIRIARIELPTAAVEAIRQ